MPIIGIFRREIRVMTVQHAAYPRLGMEYVNGAFLARDPSMLPVCQQ